MGPGINPERVRVMNSQQGQRPGIDVQQTKCMRRSRMRQNLLIISGSCLLIEFSGSTVALAPLKIEQNCLMSVLVQTGGRGLTCYMDIQCLEHEMSSV